MKRRERILVSHVERTALCRINYFISLGDKMKVMKTNDPTSFISFAIKLHFDSSNFLCRFGETCFLIYFVIT